MGPQDRELLDGGHYEIGESRKRTLAEMVDRYAGRRVRFLEEDERERLTINSWIDGKPLSATGKEASVKKKGK